MWLKSYVKTLRFLLGNLEELISGVLMVAMLLATFTGVIVRYFFNSPFPWAEEFSRYAFIWLVFIGAALCTKLNQHLIIDILINIIPPGGLQRYWLAAVDLIVAAVMLVIIYYGWRLSAAATQPTSTLKIPQSVVYFVVPFSAALILLHTLRSLYQTLRGHPPVRELPL